MHVAYTICKDTTGRMYSYSGCTYDSAVAKTTDDIYDMIRSTYDQQD
jgi:hypothetical protein